MRCVDVPIIKQTRWKVPACCVMRGAVRAFVLLSDAAVVVARLRIRSSLRPRSNFVRSTLPPSASCLTVFVAAMMGALAAEVPSALARCALRLLTGG